MRPGAGTGRRVFSLFLWSLLASTVLPVGAGEEDNYGKTPDTAIPYRNFHEPYARFFQEQVPFLGTGRDEDPAVLPDAVRIGFFAPTGPAPDADLGIAMLEGVQLAVEEANARGGYQGIPFELVLRQDIGLWGASSNEMAAFTYEDQVLAVIGSIDGANSHIALRVALKTQTPMVNTATTDPTLTETNIPWLLRCMGDDRQQGYALAYHIFKDSGLKSAVAFRVNDRYGRTGIMEFRDASRRLGYPLRAELRWNRGEREFTQQLDRIEKISPDAVVIWGNAADAAAVVKAIRARGLSVQIFGSDRLASRAFLDAAGEAAEGVVAAATYNPTSGDPHLGEFRRAYLERFKHEPETFAAHGYDGANILIESIHKGGLNRARIRDALYEYATYRGVTGLIEFDTTLNDIGPIFIGTVANGTYSYREMDFARAAPSSKGSEEPYRAMGTRPLKANSPDVPVQNSGGELRIGCFLPLDEKGEQVVAGMRKAIEASNARHPQEPPIQLLVQDTRSAWGEDSGGLVEMAFDQGVLAVVGSTERRGTHLAEMLAAKVHFPILSLCGDDPTITQIPLSWVFNLAGEHTPVPGSEKRNAHSHHDLGYDAATLLIKGIRSGHQSRKQLRDLLAGGAWHEGATGTFRFDNLGNRVDQ